jgi:hypothetical protein
LRRHFTRARQASTIMATPFSKWNYKPRHK